MDAHVLVNTIQDRLRERIEFREIVSGKQSTAEFLWGGHTFFAVGGETIVVLHMVAPHCAQHTLHSKYLQGMYWMVGNATRRVLWSKLICNHFFKEDLRC
jgi:hypothetical protein